MLTKVNKIGIFIGVCLLAGLVLLTAAYLARGTIKKVVNGYRAERLFEQAQEEFAAENWSQASRKGTAAYYLDPGNTDNQLLVARALFKQQRGEAIEWWKLVLDRPDLPVDELRVLTEVLLGANRLDDGLLFLSRLVELDGMNPQTQQLWFRALNLQARYSNSLDLASQLIERGTDEWAIHQHYISMQEALSGEEGKAIALEHLIELIESDSPLSLYAARELAGRKSAPLESRIMAADYLLENGRTRIDQLYAISVKVREGVEKEDALYPVLDGILDEPPEHMLADVARWAVWMGRSDWFVERVDWQAFRNNGNEPDLYLRTMIDAGKNRQLLDLSEQLGTQQGSDSPVFLYYRALAWQNLGDDEQAENILRLATQVVEPGEFGVLERYLLQDNRHDLLLQLYRTQLRETPGDPRLLQSLASAYYALGSQDELEALMQEIDIADYAAIPPALSFMLYLKLLLADNPTEYHMDLESFIARYPEVYDFRMVLGVSYLLQNQRELAPEFARQMPPITLSAPRYIRICAMLLGEEGVFLAPGEIEYLLPRERLLLSLVSRQANH